jgi:hypothetical protein
LSALQFPEIPDLRSAIHSVPPPAELCIRMCGLCRPVPLRQSITLLPVTAGR